MLLLWIGAIMVMGALFATLANGLSSRTSPPAPDNIQTYYESNKTVDPLTSKTPAALEKLTIPAGSKAIFFGDSWTYAQNIDDRTNGFAYLTGAALNLDAQVFGFPGGGFLSQGRGNTGTFSESLATLPVEPPTLIVAQGGTNDNNQSVVNFPVAVDKFISDLKTKYPTAQIVLLGPADATIPVSAGTLRVDSMLASAAFRGGIHYISPTTAQWITAANFDSVIDKESRHPSIQGHRYYADKLTAAILAISVPN